MAPKLPAPAARMKLQPAPMRAVVGGVWLDKGSGGPPVGDAGAGGDVPQPTAVTMSSPATNATPKDA
jgi:hypothetical protein